VLLVALKGVVEVLLDFRVVFPLTVASMYTETASVSIACSL